jgi:hypothetical protein
VQIYEAQKRISVHFRSSFIVILWDCRDGCEVENEEGLIFPLDPESYQQGYEDQLRERRYRL